MKEIVALAIVLGIAFNLMPILIAKHRKHRQRLAIIVMTVAAWPACAVFPLPGIAMWIAALVWSCTRVRTA